MRRFILLYFLLLLLSAILAHSQPVEYDFLRLPVKIERIPVTKAAKQSLSSALASSGITEELIQMYFLYHGPILLETANDTLYLIPETKGETYIYNDRLHNNQPYSITRSRNTFRPELFLILISPIPDSIRNDTAYYRNKHLYSINIESVVLYAKRKRKS